MTSIYNQINYIICQQKQQKHILNDARSYKGTSVSSDHRLLVSRINIEFYKIYKSLPNHTTNNSIAHYYHQIMINKKSIEIN